MRSIVQILFLALAILVAPPIAHQAQSAGQDNQFWGEPEWQPMFASPGVPQVIRLAYNGPLESPPLVLGTVPAPEERLALLQNDLTKLQNQFAAEQAVAPGGGDTLQKHLELLERQIETQQKMIDLLLERIKQPPPTGPVEKLQTQIATLEARSHQAAQRDQELSQSVGDLIEERDADQRYGPQLPAPLKELFLPSQTNESPLSIYGQLVSNYTQFDNGHGNFETPEFSPFFLLQLNDWILLETELGFSADGVEVSQAQVDFMANDWLTVVAGRSLVPVGFFNERLHPAWINKLPDFPLLFRQVSPIADLSENGVQLRGAKYLGCSPIKLEYAVFIANGLRLDNNQPDVTELANLAPLKDTSMDPTGIFAGGGRVGIWIPEIGVMAGVSGYFNGPYTTGGPDNFQVLQADAGYHQGNWDLRFEYAHMFQDASSFIGGPINRDGAYAQMAYRPNDAASPFIQNSELVFRFSYANFSGINPAALDLSAFESPVDVPVNRNQYTFGANYYFYPSLVLKLAYELNHEFGNIDLHDSEFLAQLAWGF